MNNEDFRRCKDARQNTSFSAYDNPEKYGHQATIRPPYAIPLKVGIYRNPFWDQLVPFGWLIMEYYLIYIKNKVNKASYLTFKINKPMI